MTRLADAERSARPGNVVGSPPHLTERTAASTSHAVAASRSLASVAPTRSAYGPAVPGLDLRREGTSLRRASVTGPPRS